MAWLACGDKRFELPEGDTIVGGGAMANWRVPGMDLMPRHFVVSRKQGAVTLRPYGTDDVVALNGRQVGAEPSRLRDGDLVAAGTGRFCFTVAEPSGEVAPAEAPTSPAYLVDAQHHSAYSLARVSTGIGRDPSNTILLHDPTASRFHAEVRREAGGYALHAMGSSGTKLNGSRVGAPALLEEGDEIEIAYVGLRFTQRELPRDVTIASHHDAEDDEASSRPTITMQRERISLPDARATLAPAPRGTSSLPWVVVAVLAIVLVLLLALR